MDYNSRSLSFKGKTMLYSVALKEIINVKFKLLHKNWLFECVRKNWCVNFKPKKSKLN